MVRKRDIVITEIAASALAITSVVILVYAFLPIINPSKFNILNKSDDFGVLRYFCGICGAGAIFWFSNRLNKKAISMRKEGRKSD
jgi:hypothetical protein